MDNQTKGHRERVRERVAQEGLRNFKEYEILEYLLFAFVPLKDTKSIAKDLIKECGSLKAVFDCAPELLRQTPNMTANAALFLSSFPQIFHRYTVSNFEEKPNLSCLEHVCAYAQNLYLNLNNEEIYLLALDSNGCLKERILIGTGSFDECELMTRKLINICYNLQSFNVYILHNHPETTAKPSENDIYFTDWCSTALDIMGITLIDHIIVGRNSIFSFRKEGKINRPIAMHQQTKAEFEQQLNSGKFKVETLNDAKGQDNVKTSKNDSKILSGTSVNKSGTTESKSRASATNFYDCANFVATDSIPPKVALPKASASTKTVKIDVLANVSKQKTNLTQTAARQNEIDSAAKMQRKRLLVADLPPETAKIITQNDLDKFEECPFTFEEIDKLYEKENHKTK